MEVDQRTGPSASPRTLLAIFSGGLVAAAVLLACVVLPAEYDIDPLGTGAALGLTGLAKSAERSTPKPAAAPAAIAGATIAPVRQAGTIESRWGEAAGVTGTFIPEAEGFRFDSREIVLQPGEGMEIKYHMREAAGLVYSWEASAPVLYDFHGQPDVAPAGAAQTDEDYFETYDHDDSVGKSAFHGTLVAPSTGIEGWYWENANAESVTIKLFAAGFFDWVYRNRDDEITKLKPTNVESLASHPRVPDELL